MVATPLQLIDNFLLPYTLGQVLLVAFVVAVLGTLPLGSRKLLSLNLATFGLVFALLPSSLAGGFSFRLLGVVLLVVAPLLYTTASR